MKKYLGFLIGLVVLLGAQVAYAYPSSFEVYTSATATTTRTYMTPGTATTTYNLAGGATEYDVDSNQLFILLTSSSTASILNWSYQYSNNGNDWFGNDYETVTSNFTVAHSSSTPVQTLAPTNSTASSTLKVVVLPAIAAVYKRVVFSVPIGAGNGAIWLSDLVRHLPAQ